MSPLSTPPAHTQPVFAEFAEVGPVIQADPARAVIQTSSARAARTADARVLTDPAATRRVAQRSYVIRPGDTPYGIAGRFGVSLHRLLQANGLVESSLIRPGQRLVIPDGSTGLRQLQKARRTGGPAFAATSSTQVTVRSGDTVDGLALRHGSSRSAIRKANGLSNTALLRPGQRLTLPRVRAAASASSTSGVHRNLSAAARANLHYLNSRPAPTRLQVRAMIVETARRHGVDPRLALAIGWQESGWNQRAVSSANAIGVMQCLPSTAEWVSGVVGRRLRLLHARDSVACGVALLRTLQRSARSEREMVAAYYQGLHSVRTRGWYADTKAYVASVIALKNRM